MFRKAAIISCFGTKQFKLGYFLLQERQKEQAYFEWMGEVLERLRAIFHADGNGLATDAIETAEFIEVKKEILIRGELALMEEQKSERACSCLP